MTTSLLNLHERLVRLGVDALLFTTSEVTASTNLRYLTGFTGSDAAILLTRTERHFFTDGRYRFQSRQETSGVHIHVERSKLDALVRTAKRLGLRRLGIEGARISYQFAHELASRADVELIPLKREFIESLRIRKSPEEKALIKKAAAIASKSCKTVIDQGLLGRKESEVAAELENLFRKNGASGIAFDTIVASGERSALPHGSPSEKVIQKGDLVILDYGCALSGYRSDETVTCKIGKPTKEEQRLYKAVKNAHDKAMHAAKVGVKARDLDKIARDTIDKEGLGNFFMHGLGHGLGLETHEPPSVSPRGRGALEEGMVFTIEPGVYVEGVGGVRLESLVYLAADGPEILSGMEKSLILVNK